MEDIAMKNLLLLILIFINFQVFGKPTFPDRNLELCIRTHLNSDVLTQAKLNTITDLECTNNPIKSIKGLEQLHNLETLKIEEYRVKEMTMDKNNSLIMADGVGLAAVNNATGETSVIMEDAGGFGGVSNPETTDAPRETNEGDETGPGEGDRNPLDDNFGGTTGNAFTPGDIGGEGDPNDFGGGNFAAEDDDEPGEGDKEDDNTGEGDTGNGGNEGDGNGNGNDSGNGNGNGNGTNGNGSDNGNGNGTDNKDENKNEGKENTNKTAKGGNCSVNIVIRTGNITDDIFGPEKEATLIVKR